jgi:hypothetical protein
MPLIAEVQRPMVRIRPVPSARPPAADSPGALTDGPELIHPLNRVPACDEAALAGSDATLDGESGPCNEASFRRREIENCCRDFRRSAYAFQGIPIRLLDEV